MSAALAIVLGIVAAALVALWVWGWLLHVRDIERMSKDDR